VDAPASHRADAPAAVRVFVLTISDTRTEATDSSGTAIALALTSAGHIITGRKILRDDPGPVAEAVRAATVSADVIITTGGTGITSRDSTYEAIARLLDKRLDGFGELFRMLSYQEIGAAAMLSRACAGTIRKTAVFSLPGSEKAVRLAMERLILPELGHVVRELKR
jgi:molybdenum cofactor biosynthesis protein B